MSEYNPYTSVRRLSSAVKFGLVDQNAAEIGVASSSSSAHPTQIEQVQTDGRSTQRLNSLEGWLLDGGGILTPPDVSPFYTGWWSAAISNDNAVYTTPPTLTYTFSQDVSCVGFTLRFSELYPYNIPTSISITTYDSSNNVVSNGTYTNDSTEFMQEQISAHIRKVVFGFNSSWMPHKRVVLDGVVFGIVIKYDDDKMSEWTLTEEISIDMSALPANKLVFNIDNTDKRYNITNPAGYYQFLQDNQKINASVVVNGKSIDMGDYLFVSSSAKNDGLVAAITAGSYVYPLDNSRYNVGMTGTWTFTEAVQSVKNESDLDFEVDIPSDIASRTVGKAIPRNTKNRTALALFAQAARCIVYFDRKNVLKALNLALTGTPADELNDDNTTSLAGVSLKDRINKVVISVIDEYAETEQSYSKQHVLTGESIRSKTFDNPVVVDGADVAQWLLDIYQRRVVYNIPARGNPELKPSDVAEVENIYGGTSAANITRLVTKYGTGLSQQIELLGGVADDN